MADIYELLATEKQCKGYLMLKDQYGSCSYCVEGLIARTLNLPEYEITEGKYTFGDPNKEYVDSYSIPQYKITEAGLPREIPLELLESLGDLPKSLKALQAETKQNTFSLIDQP